MTESFLFYDKGRFYNKNFPPLWQLIVNLLTTKKVERHKRVPLIMGGSATPWVAECCYVNTFILL